MRRALAVLTVAVAGLVLSAVPAAAAAHDGPGNMERNEWNIPLTSSLRVL